MRKKRRTALFSLLIAIVILCGCGGKPAAPAADQAVATIASAAASITPQPTVTQAEEETPSGKEADAPPTEAQITATLTPTPEMQTAANATPTPEATAAAEPTITPSEASATPTAEATVPPDPTAAPTPEATATPTPEPTVTPTPEPVQVTAAIDVNGSYTSKDDVALYIHTYGTLPGNFITKKEAQALGWSGGGLEAYAPGKCIGGDYFGNYEGRLPGGNYHECDIDTLGKNSRGAKRIIYSDTGEIYYTGDHYETFTQLY